MAKSGSEAIVFCKLGRFLLLPPSSASATQATLLSLLELLSSLMGNEESNKFHQ
jgi:hypothetical protein